MVSGTLPLRALLPVPLGSRSRDMPALWYYPALIHGALGHGTVPGRRLSHALLWQW